MKLLLFLGIFLISCSLLETEEEEKKEKTTLPTVTSEKKKPINPAIKSICSITSSNVVIGEMTTGTTFSASLLSGVSFNGEDEYGRTITGSLTEGKLFIVSDNDNSIFPVKLSVQNSFYSDTSKYLVGFVKDHGKVEFSTNEDSFTGKLVASTNLVCKINYK